MQLTMGIDRVVAFFPLPDITTESYISGSTGTAMRYRAMQEYVNTCGPNVRPGAKRWSHSEYPFTKGWFPLEPGHMLEVSYGWNEPAQRHYGRVGFNAGRLTPLSANALLIELGLLLEQDYVTLWNEGLLHRVEVFWDIVGASLSDYVFFDTALRAMRMEKRTLYFGSQNFRELAIYDRACRLSDLGLAVGGELLRIEHRWYRTQRPFFGILSLACPFASLVVLDVERLKALRPCFDNAPFLHQVLKDGLPAQEAYNKAAHKRELVASLKKAMPPWGERLYDWSNFLPLASRLRPVSVCSMAALAARSSALERKTDARTWPRNAVRRPASASKGVDLLMHSHMYHAPTTPSTTSWAV